MNYCKRAIHSIFRRRIKSLIIFLIVFIIGNFILASLISIESVNATKKSVVKRMPPIVNLDIDHEKRDDKENSSDKFIMPYITFEDLDRVEVTCAPYLKSYDYFLSFGIETDSLKSFSLQGDNDLLIKEGQNNLSLKGEKNCNFTLLETGDAKIAKGRSFTKEEINSGRPVLIISRDMAELNNLDIGDLVIIDVPITGFEEAIIRNIVLEFELIGILEYNKISLMPYTQNVSYNYFKYLELERINTLYTTKKYVEDFVYEYMMTMRQHTKETMDLDLGDYDPLAGKVITYILNSSEEVNNFVEMASATLNNDYYFFTTQEDNYNKIAKPLEKMKSILTYILYSLLVSIVIVLALITFNFARERQNEIGIYLALGEKKIHVVTQLIIETGIIGLIGALMSLISGRYLASVISHYYVFNPDFDESSFYILTDGGYIPNIGFNTIIDNYRIFLSPLTIAIFLGVITSTVIAAQVISVLLILKNDPRKLM